MQFKYKMTVTYPQQITFELSIEIRANKLLTIGYISLKKAVAY